MNEFSTAEFISTTQKNISDLQHCLEVAENLLYQTKEVLTLEEASKLTGLSRSSLYKIPHMQTIPFYKPAGKLLYFECTDLLARMRQNRYATKSEIADEAHATIQELAKA